MITHKKLEVPIRYTILYVISNFVINFTKILYTLHTHPLCEIYCDKFNRKSYESLKSLQRDVKEQCISKQSTEMKMKNRPEGT